MTAPSTLAAGFSDPVLHSQSVFRSVLDAMANPGRVISLNSPLPATHTALPQGLAMILLTLADYETPVFLDDAFDTDLHFADCLPVAFRRGCHHADRAWD